MILKRRLSAALLVLLLPVASFAQQANNAVIRYQDLQHPVLGSAGMVAAQNRESAAAGAAVLADGGTRRWRARWRDRQHRNDKKLLHSHRR